MRCTIRQGAHFTAGWARVWNALPWFGVRAIERAVFFDDNCRYDSPAYNAEDVNKLFGLSFGLHPRRQADGSWDLGTHWNSARYGWVWSVSRNCWKLLAYVYLNGVLQRDAQLRFPELLTVASQEQVSALRISYVNVPEYGTGVFRFTGQKLGERFLFDLPAAPRLPVYGLRLGFYFGGIRPASHRMDAHISRL